MDRSNAPMIVEPGARATDRYPSLETHRYTIFDHQSRPPIEDILAIIEGSWDTEYARADKCYFKFDEAYIKWLLPEGCSFGALAQTEKGAPVGCLVQVEREIFAYGEKMSAYYGTMLSTRSEHRNAGVGLRILVRAFEEMFGARKVDLFLGILDAGQGGRPTVTKAIKLYDPSFQLLESVPMVVWGCTDRVLESDRYEPFRGIERLALLPPFAALLSFRATAEDLTLPAREVPLGEVMGRAGAGYALATGPGQSAARMYAQTDHSGTLLFEFGSRERCFVSYHITTCAKQGLPDCLNGNLQLIDPGTASPSNVVRALRHVNAKLLRDGGCLTTLALDTGVVSPWTLLRAGFTPGGDRKLSFVLMGPRDKIARFLPLKRPYLCDFF